MPRRKLPATIQWEITALAAIHRASRRKLAQGGDAWVKPFCIKGYKPHPQSDWLLRMIRAGLIVRNAFKGRSLRLTRRGEVAMKVRRHWRSAQPGADAHV